MKKENRKAAYDKPTLNFYDMQAGECAALYNSSPSPYVEMISAFLEKSEKILDVGCGSGRDLRAFLDAGFDAYGIEPSAGMRETAKRSFSLGEERLISGGLPLQFEEKNSSWLKEEHFGLVLCSAVLQHIEERELFESLFSLNRAVKDGGHLFLAVPLVYPGIDQKSGRDAKGRKFILRPPEEYIYLMSRQGFDLTARRDKPDTHGRSGVIWTNLVFRKVKGRTLRPIKQIESILREDNKTTPSNSFPWIRK
jgi:SAM-dependent methyltransferase